MKRNTRFLAAVLAVMLILPGCKSSSSVMDQASGLMGLANGIPEISKFIGLAQLGGLAGMMGGGNPFTLLAPSNDALESLGADALSRLSTPDGAADLKKMLESSVVPGTPSVDDLASKLGGAKILKTEKSDDGVIHVIDSLL